MPELDSARLLQVHDEIVDPAEQTAPPQDTTKTLESIVTGVSYLVIVLSIIGGGWWWSQNGNQMLDQATKPISLGEMITGKTWKERKAEGTIGVLDAALWPESKDDPIVIEFPEPVNVGDMNFHTFHTRYND